MCAPLHAHARQRRRGDPARALLAHARADCVDKISAARAASVDAVNRFTVVFLAIVVHNWVLCCYSHTRALVYTKAIRCALLLTGATARRRCLVAAAVYPVAARVADTAYVCTRALSLWVHARSSSSSGGGSSTKELFLRCARAFFAALRQIRRLRAAVASAPRYLHHAGCPLGLSRALSV